MRAPALFAALLTASLFAPGASAQTIGPVDPGAPMELSAPRDATINGTRDVPVRDTPGASQGFMVPDAKGGYVHYAPGPAPAPPPASRADAEEVRLYARELASQITRGISGDASLTGVVSVPSAFVDQDTRMVTPFGRLMGEQMIYELNSRGFPVQEARGAAPAATKSKGRKAAAPAQPFAVLAGSYYADKDNLFVNARLVEPSGRVLRTGSALIPMTPTLRRMLGLPEPNPSGLRPTPPVLIGSRDVNDPPGSGVKTPTPYSPQPKKKAPPKKAVKPKAKAPCPPGCEPIDTNAKAASGQGQQPPAQPGEK